LSQTLKLAIKQRRKKPSLQKLHQDITSWKSKIHTATSDRALTTTRNFQIGTARVSTLISASVVLESGSPTPGRLYLAVFIEDEDQIIQATLFKGYVYDQHPVDGNGALAIREGDKLRIESKSSLAGITLRIRGRQLRNQVIPGGWTGTDEGMLEGPGFLRSITMTNPAAGTFQSTEDCPTGARWLVRSARVPMTADGNAANRRMAAFTDDGNVAVTTALSNIDHVASTSRTYFFIPGLGAIASAVVNVTEIVPMGADVRMFAGWTFTISIFANPQAGDNIGTPQLHVEEWLEP